MAHGANVPPLPSRDPRPSTRTPRFVERTLGKLRHDSTRIEHNSRCRTPSSAQPQSEPSASPDPLQPIVERGGKFRVRPASQPQPLRETPDSGDARLQDFLAPLPQHLQDLPIPAYDQPLSRPETRSDARCDSKGEADWPLSRGITPDAEFSDAGFRSLSTPLGFRPLSGLDVSPDVLPAEFAMPPSNGWQDSSHDLGGRPWVLADMERWRAAFREELQECARVIRSSLDEANVTRLVTEFMDWRQKEYAEREQMQEHLSELLRVNSSLRQSQLDWFTTRGVDRIIENAVVNSAQAGAEQATHAVSERLDSWHERFFGFEQSLGQLLNLEAKLEEQVAEINEAVTGTIAEQTKAQREESAATQDRFLEQVNALRFDMEKASAPQMEKIEKQFEAAMCQSRRKSTAVSMSQIHELLLKQDESMEERFGKATENFKELTETLTRDCEEWQHRFIQAEHALLETKSRASTADHECSQLRAQCEHLQHKLEVASTKPALDLIAKVKAIENHGNVQVNLSNGDVDIVKPLDFLPRGPRDEPTAEFADVKLASAIVDDIADLQHLFNVNLCVEGHTKGSSGEFYQKLADNRAELIKKHLQFHGIEERFIEAKGLPGPLGVNRPCVIIRLDIFPDND